MIGQRRSVVSVGRVNRNRCHSFWPTKATTVMACCGHESNQHNGWMIHLDHWSVLLVGVLVRFGRLFVLVDWWIVTRG